MVHFFHDRSVGTIQVRQFLDSEKKGHETLYEHTTNIRERYVRTRCSKTPPRNHHESATEASDQSNSAYTQINQPYINACWNIYTLLYIAIKQEQRQGMQDQQFDRVYCP